MKRCDHCCFYQPNSPADRAGQITITCDGMYGGGECRRHPPRREDSFPIARFPIVAGDWWCGEFAPASEDKPV